MKTTIICGVVVLTIVLVAVFVPLFEVPYTVAAKYDATEIYYVSEPYTVQEPYTQTQTYYEQEPYQISVPIDYVVTEAKYYNWFWNPGCDVWVKIRNTDLMSGTFDVTFRVTLKGGAIITRSGSEYTAIGDTETVMVKYAGDRCSSFTYSVTPPLKTVTDYRTVKKTRQVTGYREVVKYRDVAKERTVTRERQETRYKRATILQYLLDYLDSGRSVNGPAPPADRAGDPADYVQPNNSTIRGKSISVIQDAPLGVNIDSQAWKIWKIHYWVSMNINYVSDPSGHEYFAYATETLQLGAGDCDDFAILLASMYGSVGLDTALAYIDTDGNGRADHMSCLVYYPAESKSFLEAQLDILRIQNMRSPTGKAKARVLEAAGSTALPRYSYGIWIVADPLMSSVKGLVGYIEHEPYNIVRIVDLR